MLVSVPSSQALAVAMYPFASAQRVCGARLRDRVLVGYARMPDHPFKLRLLRAFARSFNPKPMVRLPGGNLLRIAPDDYIGWYIIKHGDYEPQTVALAARILSQTQGCFVDVGANVGLFTLAVCGIQGVNVVAIEPDCENCARLRENVSLNKAVNVRIFNGGVSSNVGVAAISARTKGNSGSVFTSDRSDVGEANQDWAPMLRLEQVLSWLMPSGLPLLLIKLDIEGAERDALDGIDWDGPWKPRNLIFEYNALSAEAWGSSRDMSVFFADRGYELFDVAGSPFDPDAALIEDNIWARDLRYREPQIAEAAGV